MPVNPIKSFTSGFSMAEMAIVSVSLSMDLFKLLSCSRLTSRSIRSPVGSSSLESHSRLCLPEMSVYGALIECLSRSVWMRLLMIVRSRVRRARSRMMLLCMRISGGGT